eukprot:gnl/TRDRNA2_/TRDRNA2_85509_c0_seq3.p1 gnl/TRDRNA2_/TRDRNA2_85509_c0~~gnl/TRDRNA2_/TRDRNA2_85509_c0_seq3.p1  ORF type:complete len:366 (+),score=59.48 gnl/TRDRNA2_/TRDRNA2_85509_c0_seq3:61-1098(+)
MPDSPDRHSRTPRRPLAARDAVSSGSRLAMSSNLDAGRVVGGVAASSLSLLATPPNSVWQLPDRVTPPRPEAWRSRRTAVPGIAAKDLQRDDAASSCESGDMEIPPCVATPLPVPRPMQLNGGDSWSGSTGAIAQPRSLATMLIPPRSGNRVEANASENLLEDDEEEMGGTSSSLIRELFADEEPTSSPLPAPPSWNPSAQLRALQLASLGFSSPHDPGDSESDHELVQDAVLTQAIDEVRHMVNTNAMSSEWTSVLADLFARLSSQSSNLRKVLDRHGWTGSQFAGPPDRQALLADLQQAWQTPQQASPVDVTQMSLWASEKSCDEDDDASIDFLQRIKRCRLE